MGKISADFVFGFIGSILLAHAAYATIIYRGELKIKEEEFVRPPPQVLVEVAISLALCFWAALRVPGTFLPILSDSKENSGIFSVSWAEACEDSRDQRLCRLVERDDIIKLCIDGLIPVERLSKLMEDHMAHVD